jgi:hypothetical protein
MPYYIYRISESAGSVVKHLELLATYDNYRDAKQLAKKTRSEMDTSEPAQIKVMFADNELMAEEQLLEKREKPVVMEWEK